MSMNQKAMLVHLRIGMWTGTHRDSQVSKKVCKDLETSKDAGTWWTHYIPPKDLKPLISAAGFVRSTWRKWTMPWLDGGTRIIPFVRYAQYQEKIKGEIDNYNKACEDFLTNRYPIIYQESNERLKTLKKIQMPTVEDLRFRFNITHQIFPLPSTDDFRMQGVSEDEVKKVKEKMEESIKIALDETIGFIWQSLLNLLEKVDTVMSQPDKKFKDSLIKKLEQFIDDLPSLNISDNPDLEEMRKKIKKQFTGIDPQDLRESELLRKGVAKKAKEVIAEITTKIGDKGRKFDLDIE